MSDIGPPRGQTRYGIGAPSTYGSAPSFTEQMERSGRRLAMLQQWTPEVVTADPTAALAMAEGPDDDDEILRAAASTRDFAALNRLREEIAAEDETTQAAIWASLPQPLAEAMEEMGVNVPEPIGRDDDGGESRFGIDLPDFLPGPDELTLPDSTPILGDVLAPLQHGAGEVLEGARDTFGKVTRPFSWLGQQSSRWFRASQIGAEEGLFRPGPSLDVGQTFRLWGEAWDRAGATGEGYVRPAHQGRARKLVGNDRALYRMAHMTAQGYTPEQMIEEFGYEPQSSEAGQFVVDYAQAQQEADFQAAVRELSTGKVSFGRTIAQRLGLDDTDSGLGRAVSGTLDAGFSIAVDPTLAAGAVTASARFGRHAYRLETAQDVDRGYRMVDLATESWRARQGLPATQPLAGRAGAAEMRRAGQVVDWADLVAGHVTNGDWAGLARRLPRTATSLDTMANAHTRRLADGLPGLDTTEGVLGWLRDRDGQLAIAGSRLGGGQPLQRGLRIPALTRADRARIRTTELWQQGVDRARVWDYDDYKAMLDAADASPSLRSQVANWVGSHTVGNVGRVTAALTSHTPYSPTQRLFGDGAVEEFGRLVNTGIFVNLSRRDMDDYVNAFAEGDFVTRANAVTNFLTELFDRSGIADTDFARRFTDRHNQAYSLDDPSRTARLVDGHHGDAMAIPRTRDFLRETSTVNRTRMLFHNTPATTMDYALGRFWKPSVLMRIGFIPRAAGEEVLHFVLKHGPTPLLGAKGAEWAVRDDLRFDLEARLVEAEDAGRLDEVNRIQQRLARDGTVSAPLRSLTAAADRMWMHAWEQADSRLSWRRRLAEKRSALDDRGVVSGLEHVANQVALQSQGFLEWLGAQTRMPGKARVGQWMAERWSPDSLDSAYLLLTSDRFARAYTERISGSTFIPDEFRGIVDVNGSPVSRITVPGVVEGRSVMQEVDLRPAPGEWQRHRLHGTGQDSQAYFENLYRNIQRISGDRAASRLVERVLPRWTGTWGGDVASRLGTADAAEARRSLNELWGHRPADEVEPLDVDMSELPDLNNPDIPVPDAAEPATGRQMLAAWRTLLDDPDAGEGLKRWLSSNVDRVASERGLTLSGQGLVSLLDDNVPEAARRWAGYEQVNPDALVENWEQLESQMRYGARARMARPDMYPRLREMRGYDSDRMARPVANGISKVYVPMIDGSPDALVGDFVDAASKRISMIGGYSPERARVIAENVSMAANGDDVVAAAGLIGGPHVPLAAWGAADPRVAEAVMAAYQQVTGRQATWGILEVPDDALQRATGQAAIGLRSAAPDWKVADDYTIEPWRLAATTPTDQLVRQVQLDTGDEWWDELELDGAMAAAGRPPGPGRVRLWSSDRETWHRDEAALADDEGYTGPAYFVDVPESMTGPAAGEGYLVRYDRPDADLSGANKPQGMYWSLRSGPDDETPFADLVDDDPTVQRLPARRPAAEGTFEVPTTPVRLEERTRRILPEGSSRQGSATDMSAGVGALYHLDRALYDELAGLGREALEVRMRQRFPAQHDYSRYADTYEILEVAGAEVAREQGYRGLISRDPTGYTPESDFTEYVALTDDAVVGDDFVQPDDDLIEAHGVRRIPPRRPDGRPQVYARQVSEGLGEIEALERTANLTVEEVVDTLTTRRRRDVDDDVLHEVIEPLLRGSRVREDGMGNEAIEAGLGFDHLVGHVSHDRLPLETYGPRMVAERDLRWDRIVSEWFAGPVDGAVSSIIRKPMFVHQFGEQLRNQRGLVSLFVEEEQRAAVAALFGRLGIEEDDFESVADRVSHVLGAAERNPALADAAEGPALGAAPMGEDDVAEFLSTIADREVSLTSEEMSALRTFAEQHAHGIDLIRGNAMNRAMELVTPFLDDHRVRSAFQNYVGNFIPFHFAEESFIKRWARSMAESPEMIRRGQLAMNGLRSMGVLRTDSTGQTTFVYPLYGEAVEAISHAIPGVFGEKLRVPFSIAMTGDAGYTLPGLGDQVGVPSVGPLIGVPVELLSRHHPQMADFEQNLLGPGANKDIWEFFVPTQLGRMWTSIFGDIDQGQLASAQLQAIQTMALNGQLPPETASPAQQQEFLDNAAGVARSIVFARGLFGMASPASPGVETAADTLNEEFNGYLRAAGFEDAFTAMVAAHPDIEPLDLLAVTQSKSDATYAGEIPTTQAAYDWMVENNDLVEAFPAAVPWMMPRGDAGDPFSYRAYNQQIVKGLRKRKSPEDFVGDLHFAIGANDYFQARKEHEAAMLTAVGPSRADEVERWDTWKAAYFRQHPLFADMLADPTRNQRRRDGLEQLTTLSASEGVVPDDVREMVQAFDNFRLNIAGLRGDRRTAVVRRRQEMTEELYAEMQWMIERSPHLAGLYMRLIEPELVDLDEDSIVEVA